jgi:hypothetical protein
VITASLWRVTTGVALDLPCPNVVLNGVDRFVHNCGHVISIQNEARMTPATAIVSIPARTAIARDGGRE